MLTIFKTFVLFTVIGKNSKYPNIENKALTMLMTLIRIYIIIVIDNTEMPIIIL